MALPPTHRRASDYGGETLKELIANVAKPGIVVIDKPTPVDKPPPDGARVECPADVTLKFERGGVATFAQDHELAVEGEIEAGVFKIFEFVGADPDLTVVTAGQKTDTTEVRPEWWGALADYVRHEGGADDQPAIQAAIDFYGGLPDEQDGGRVLFRPRGYGCQSPITLRDSIWLLGQSGSNVRHGTTLFYEKQPLPEDDVFDPPPELALLEQYQVSMTHDPEMTHPDHRGAAFVSADGRDAGGGQAYIHIRIENMAFDGLAVTVPDAPSAPTPEEPNAPTINKQNCEDNLLDSPRVGIWLKKCVADFRNVQIRGFRDRCLSIQTGISSRFVGLAAADARHLIDIRGNTTTTSFLTCRLDRGTRRAFNIIGDNKTIQIGDRTWIQHCWGDGIYINLCRGGVTAEGVHFEDVRGHFIHAGETNGVDGVARPYPSHWLDVNNCEFIPGLLTNDGGSDFDLVHLNHVQYARVDARQIVDMGRRAIIHVNDPNTKRLFYIAPMHQVGQIGQEIHAEGGFLAPAPNMARVLRIGESNGIVGSDSLILHANAAGMDTGLPFLTFRGQHQISAAPGQGFNIRGPFKKWWLWWLHRRGFIKATIHDPPAGPYNVWLPFWKAD